MRRGRYSACYGAPACSEFTGERLHDFTGAIRAPVIDQNDLIRLDAPVDIRMDLANDVVDNFLFVEGGYDKADASNESFLAQTSFATSTCIQEFVLSLLIAANREKIVRHLVIACVHDLVVHTEHKNCVEVFFHRRFEIRR